MCSADMWVVTRGHASIIGQCPLLSRFLPWLKLYRTIGLLDLTFTLQSRDVVAYRPDFDRMMGSLASIQTFIGWWRRLPCRSDDERLPVWLRSDGLVARLSSWVWAEWWETWLTSWVWVWWKVTCLTSWVWVWWWETCLTSRVWAGWYETCLTSWVWVWWWVTCLTSWVWVWWWETCLTSWVWAGWWGDLRL